MIRLQIRFFARRFGLTAEQAASLAHLIFGGLHEDRL